MTDINVDSLESIRRRLEAAGGEDCAEAANRIDTFLTTNGDGFSQEQACRMLHDVWGRVSRALDLSSCQASLEPDMCDLEAHLAAKIGEYRDADGVM